MIESKSSFSQVQNDVNFIKYHFFRCYFYFDPLSVDIIGRKPVTKNQEDY